MPRSFPDTDEWGVVTRFHDALGQLHEIPPAVLARLHAAMGLAPGQPAPTPPEEQVLVANAGDSLALPAPAELTLEEGTFLGGVTALPPDLPMGYHTLRDDDTGSERLLIVSPRRCHLPEGLRSWGWAIQCYALRSERSWGLGDLSDLERFARWSAEEHRAGFLLLNPLSAATPLIPQEASPYSASSRLFRSLLYLDIESLPGVSEAGLALEPLRAAAHALNGGRLLDRDAVFRLKLTALEALWGRFGGAPGFDRYRAEIGAPLTRFARFSALAEHHKSAWQAWPDEHRHPDAPGVARFAAEHAGRVRFHAWIQWLLDEQVRKVAEASPLMQDLPVGFDPDGADSWAFQDALALDARIGAPPDDFNPRGQNWGLPPFAPAKLAAAGYEPFIRTLRMALRHSRALRIDHVMGLFRLFWIPLGASAGEGTYVRQASDHLLAIAAIESERARAVIVGEDLGTVEAGVREELAARRMPSYRLLWFEPGTPDSFPTQSLAAVTTHDLPTIAGIWTGREREMQASVGLAPRDATLAAMRERLRQAASAADGAAVEDVVARVHAALAGAPSILVTAALDDALGVLEPANRPGTRFEWPNWSLALPASLEEIQRSPLVRSVAAALRDKRPDARSAFDAT